MAEFQLSAKNPKTPNGGGFYDPAPAFWSASVGSTVAADPPISSGIF